MQAILIKINTERAKEQTLKCPYLIASDVLGTLGFRQELEGFFVGEKRLNPVDAVLAVQTLYEEWPFLRVCTVDIRLLDIRSDSDLFRAISFNRDNKIQSKSFPKSNFQIRRCYEDQQSSAR